MYRTPVFSLQITKPEKSKLATLINAIFKYVCAPNSIKSGYKIPIPKKDRDSTIRDNFRGLVITPIMGKLLEHVIHVAYEDQYKKFDDCMQFGFTVGKSPSMCILMLTESAAHAKINGTDLYIATMDARKAFDVVDHNQLKTKLYMSGICSKMWCWDRTRQPRNAM